MCSNDDASLTTPMAPNSCAWDVDTSTAILPATAPNARIKLKSNQTRALVYTLNSNTKQPTTVSNAFSKLKELISACVR